MWEISIPDPEEPGHFLGEEVFDSREKALQYAKDVWGADENGMICIVNQYESEAECTSDCEGCFECEDIEED